MLVGIFHFVHKAGETVSDPVVPLAFTSLYIVVCRLFTRGVNPLRFRFPYAVTRNVKAYRSYSTKCMEQNTDQHFREEEKDKINYGDHYNTTKGPLFLLSNAQVVNRQRW